MMDLKVLKLSFLVHLLFSVAASTAIGQDAPVFQDDPDIQIGSDFDFDLEGIEDFGADSGPAELTPEQAAAATTITIVMFIGAALFCLLGLFLTGLVAYWMSDALNSVPEQFRQLSPGVPWLLFVPIVNIVVLFLVVLKVPESLNAYLSSVGNTSQGDCGKSTGLWGAILYVLGCTAPIGLVMLIMAIMKINQAKKVAKSI